MQFGYQGNRRRSGGDSTMSSTSRPRSIGQIVSSNRRSRVIAATNNITHSDDYGLRARADIDTKADTVCAGATFKLHEDTGKIVDVFGFHDSLGSMKNIAVGTSITAIYERATRCQHAASTDSCNLSAPDCKQEEARPACIQDAHVFWKG